MRFPVLTKMQEPTAGSHKSSGNEFQTVGLATEKHGFQPCCSEQTVDDVWHTRCWQLGTLDTSTQ